MRAAKVDRNQGTIVAALRRVGCRVAITSRLGAGFPDLVVESADGRRIALAELKDGTLPPSARKMTADEGRFHAQFRHACVWTGVEDALAWALDDGGKWKPWRSNEHGRVL